MPSAFAIGTRNHDVGFASTQIFSSLIALFGSVNRDSVGSAR